MRRYWGIIVLLCVTISMAAQETILVGDIFSEETGEPIANANIYYQGTQIGTSSNEDGAFMLRTELNRKRVVVISAVGYQTQRYQIEPGTMAGVQVAMKEKTATIEEVYIRPGANPAIPLVAAVRAHRAENDRSLQGGSANATAVTELYISDIEAKHLKRRLWKSLRGGMLEGEDSTLMLPLYMSRQAMSLEGNQSKATGKKEEKALALSATDYSALLTNDGNLNFYQNSVPLLGHSFLSPLAAAGTTYYNYYLVDSVQTESGKEYLVHFRTKNPFYATFNGEMRIDSASFALRSITADVPAQNGLNYLKDVHIQQQLGVDNSLQDEQISALLDFAVKTDTTHLFPSVLVRHSLKGSTLQGEQIHVAAIPDSTENAFAALDSVPLVKFAKWTAAIINTGYIPTGTVVDIGNIQEILQVNEHETVHVGLPFRTNEKLMKHVALEAAVGYGFRDHAFKGMGRISVQLPTLRRNVFFLEYHDRYVWTEVDDFSKLLHENGIGFHTMDFTAYAFEALRYNKLAVNTATRQRQIQLHFENDWTDNLETQLYARIGWMGYGNPLVGYHEIPDFRYQTVGAILRVGFRERKIDDWFSRYHVYSDLPVLYFGLEGGSFITNDMAQYHMFGKLNFMLRHHVRLGMAGTLDYVFQAGCIFGKVPYPFLHHFEGNQGYAYDPYRFTLLNNFNYAADKWVALHAEWNGQGILFNLIPGVRRLRLRELATLKLAWGGCSDKHYLLSDNLPFCQNMDSKMPYIELGCGIGNILRVLDIHSVWRLTTPVTNTTNLPYWAMRFRIHITL